MKTVYLQYVVTIVLVLFSAGCSKPYLPPPEISGNLSENIVQWAEWAEKDNKLLLLYFRADWCDYCKQLDRVLLKEDLLSLQGDKYIQQRVDVGNFDLNMEIYQQYMGEDVKAVPALAILKKDATIKIAVTGAEWGENDQEVYLFIHSLLENNSK